MPPPRVTKAFVNTATTGFTSNIGRARELYRKVVLHGYTRAAGASPARLQNPDTRDVAQFIFFEVAAQFEDYAKKMFQAEVRSKLRVTVDQSAFIMGDADRGLDTKLGWGSPTLLRARGRNLMGGNSFFATIHTTLGTAVFNELVAAHTVRNRIAHSGGQAQAKFVTHLKGLGIPAAQRMGMGCGRFIRDYPAGVPAGDKYFFVYLRAYELFANSALAALP